MSETLGSLPAETTDVTKHGALVNIFTGTSHKKIDKRTFIEENGGIIRHWW